MVSYTGIAYRRFALGVERLSSFYSAQKIRFLKGKSGKPAITNGDKK